MEFQTVIKVKYGDTLRRFNIYQRSGLPNLNMEGLMTKVISLFNFTADADVTLTYIDEDDDAVTLVDDADLIDALKQNLNPLRINVHANIEKSGKISDNSSGSSTSLGSAPVDHLLPGLNTSLTEVLKLVPEQLHESLRNLYLELASKAASSAPVIAEAVQTLLSEVRLNAVSKLCPSADSTRQNGDNQNSSFPLTTDLGVSKNAMPVPLPESLQDTKNLVSNSENIYVSRGVGTSFGPFSATADLNLPLNSSPVFETPKAAPVSSDVVAGENKNSMNESKSKVSGKPADFMGRSGGYRRNSSMNNGSLCPFGGLPLVNQSTTHSASHPYIHPSRRAPRPSDNIPVFHRGVSCDGCGVTPITGPRFKSLVKVDYDLCSVCFARLGNEADYFRMEKPELYGHPLPSKGLFDCMPPPSFHPPAPHQLSARMKPLYRYKLDSRFVQDVNVMDGTVMAPSTQFTKIWRMRNSGMVVWPPGTQLAWIGGDKLCDTLSVQMFEIPPLGVPVDTELDVAVDFKAPELPGRYISYWKMSLPSGQKFGQRVWVIIQVDASLKETSCESLRGLNLNLPPESCGSENADFIDAEGRRLIEVSPPEFWNTTIYTESAEQVAAKQAPEDQELHLPMKDTLPVSNDIRDTNPPVISSSVSYPVINFADVPPAATSHEPLSSVSYPVVDFAHVSPVAASYEPSLVRNALESSGKTVSNEDVGEIMLNELREVGMKQVDLNEEIASMSEFNLVNSADDLCGVAEWDQILEELEEMGFCDAQTNRKMLKKYNGSILRVVMDLVAAEKNSAKEKTQ